MSFQAVSIIVGARFIDQPRLINLLSNQKAWIDHGEDAATLSWIDDSE